MPASRGEWLLGPASFQATRRSVVAQLCRPLDQRAGVGGQLHARIVGIGRKGLLAGLQPSPISRAVDGLRGRAISRGVSPRRKHCCAMKAGEDCPGAGVAAIAQSESRAKNRHTELLPLTQRPRGSPTFVMRLSSFSASGRRLRTTHIRAAARRSASVLIFEPHVLVGGPNRQRHQIDRMVGHPGTDPN